MHPFVKTVTLTALVFASANAVLAGGSSLQVPTKPIQIKPQIGLNKHLKAPDILRRSCVDLAVFASKTRVGDRVRITYGVRNVSTANYVSGANQQAIVISTYGGAVGTGRFTNLAAGQSRSWSVDVPLAFEFPNTYQVYYSYDPDLYIDGNTANDDCNRANNQREVTVSHTG
ncbi:MAG: hypothetical protein R3D85_08050 [Paracoccaceae bacterium]